MQDRARSERIANVKYVIFIKDEQDNIGLISDEKSKSAIMFTRLARAREVANNQELHYYISMVPTDMFVPPRPSTLA